MELASIINDSFVSAAEEDSRGDPANVVDGLFAIARALDGVAHALHRLGNADAATPMGAMEAFGLVMKDGMEEIAASITAAAMDEDRRSR